jgi:drug/metabolite transporter (DMT)-like permease
MSSAPASLARARRRQGFLALVFVQVFFGLFSVFVKLAEDAGRGFTPRALVSWRIAFAALALGTLAAAREGRRALPRAADVPRLFACALLGVVFNQLLAIEGIVRSSVIDGGLLMVLIPVFTYALAVLVGQELLRWRRALGIALAFAGASLLVLAGERTATAGPERLLGNLLIVLNCLSYASFLVVVRPLLARYSSLTVIAWVFLLAAPTLPFLLTGQPLLPRAGTPSVWGAFAYLLVFSTLLAYLLNTYALARVSASTTAVFIALQPLVAGLGAWVVFHEPPGPVALAAAALLLAGIWLVTRTPALRSRAAADEARSADEIASASRGEV